MTSFGYIIVVSCIISLNLNCILQLKQFYNIATKFSCRKKCYYFWWSTWLVKVWGLRIKHIFDTHIYIYTYIYWRKVQVHFMILLRTFLSSKYGKTRVWMMEILRNECLNVNCHLHMNLMLLKWNVIGAQSTYAHYIGAQRVACQLYKCNIYRKISKISCTTSRN